MSAAPCSRCAGEWLPGERGERSSSASSVLISPSSLSSLAGPPSVAAGLAPAGLGEASLQGCQRVRRGHVSVSTGKPGTRKCKQIGDERPGGEGLCSAGIGGGGDGSGKENWESVKKALKTAQPAAPYSCSVLAKLRSSWRRSATVSPSASTPARAPLLPASTSAAAFWLASSVVTSCLMASMLPRSSAVWACGKAGVIHKWGH